jgi:prepilin-type N-terminal cleavage/methylation domain-containing protein
MVLFSRTKKGVTLVELLLAAAILSLASAVLFLLFGNCILLNEFNRNRSIALSHAQYVLEEIKNSNFTTLEADINDGDWDWNTNQLENIFDPGDNIEIIPLRSEVIDTNVNDIGVAAPLLDVVATVTWQSRGGENRVITLETLIAGQ